MEAYVLNTIIARNENLPETASKILFGSVFNVMDHRDKNSIFNTC